MTVPRKDRLNRAWLGHLLVFLWVSASVAQGPASHRELSPSFTHPPDDCRIMVRWWWFGPAVTKSEIRQELEQMKSAGVGGVEIATLYPLALDDHKPDFETSDSCRTSILMSFDMLLRKPGGWD